MKILNFGKKELSEEEKKVISDYQRKEEQRVNNYIEESNIQLENNLNNINKNFIEKLKKTSLNYINEETTKTLNFIEELLNNFKENTKNFKDYKEIIDYFKDMYIKDSNEYINRIKEEFKTNIDKIGINNFSKEEKEFIENCKRKISEKHKYFLEEINKI